MKHTPDGNQSALFTAAVCLMRSPAALPAKIRCCLVGIKNQSGEAPHQQPARTDCCNNISEQTATQANVTLKRRGKEGGGREVEENIRESSLFRRLQFTPSCNFSNDVNVQQAEGVPISSVFVLIYSNSSKRERTEVQWCLVVNVVSLVAHSLGGLGAGIGVNMARGFRKYIKKNIQDSSLNGFICP